MNGDELINSPHSEPKPRQSDRFQRIVENSHAGYFRIGMDGCFEDVNPAWLSMHGFTCKEEAVGQHFSIVQVPGDIARAEEIVELLMHGESVNGSESSRLRRDGSVGYQTFSANPVFEGDQVVGIEGFLIDITEHKLAKEELEQLHKVMSAAQLAAHFGVFRWDANTGKSDWSPETYLFHGLDPATTESSFDSWFQTVHKDDRDRVSREFREVLDSQDGRVNIEYRSADGGRWITGSGQLYRDSEGKPHHIVGIDIEITERKRMEEALRKSEEKFSRAFHSSPAAITIADLVTGFYLEVNGTFETLTGYRRDEVIGHSWGELNLWTDISSRDQAIALLLKNGSLQNWNFGFRRKNGDLGTGLLSADLIEIDGNPCAITATIDITERLQLESQLIQAQKLESIGRLAGGVAHDFNNLLTVILGYSELLLQGIASTDPLQPCVEAVTQAAERAASLTKQLLAFSRKSAIERKPLDLNIVVRNSERFLHRLIGEDITFLTALDPHLEQVMADPDQVHQVLMNLVVNARDAMPHGGRLEISTLNVEVGENEAALQPGALPGRYVLLTVTDSGHGMDEKILQHIFEPFFTTKEVGKGTGLGLSTAYGIMQQNGGWICVSSGVGVGTTFSLYFPRGDGASVSEPREATVIKAPHGGETILLVEDQEAVRDIARTILKMYGYHVLEAANGDEALRIAANHLDEIDLLLTDVVLPGMNGKELSERLKALRPALKVLFMSGYTSDVIGHHGVFDPGMAMLHKPFRQEVLARKVRDVLADS